jgi:hypothetical protein
LVDGAGHAMPLYFTHTVAPRILFAVHGAM